MNMDAISIVSHKRKWLKKNIFSPCIYNTQCLSIRASSSHPSDMLWISQSNGDNREVYI